MINFRPLTYLLLTTLLMTQPLWAIVPAGDSSPALAIPSASPPIVEEPPQPVDLVDERPTAMGLILNYSTQTVGWVWGALRDNVFSWIIPPTPASLTSSVSKKDANQLFKLLSDAGYKLKEIYTDVGIIPGLSFKFGQVRELSEADYEYLESLVIEWERANPGLYATLQRKIIKTVISVNQSGDYRVATLTVKLLPLPDVAFSMTPKQVFLGEESSTLMRAIQRVERTIRTIGTKEKDNNKEKEVNPNPREVRKN